MHENKKNLNWKTNGTQKNEEYKIDRHQSTRNKKETRLKLLSSLFHIHINSGCG